MCQTVSVLRLRATRTRCVAGVDAHLLRQRLSGGGCGTPNPAVGSVHLPQSGAHDGQKPSGLRDRHTALCRSRPPSDAGNAGAGDAARGHRLVAWGRHRHATDGHEPVLSALGERVGLGQGVDYLCYHDRTPALRHYSGSRLSESQPLALSLDGNLANRHA